MGMNQARERKRASTKRCYFEGTNWKFYCKQRTYKSSTYNNRRSFDAKQTRFEAKDGPKTAFNMALKHSLGTEKAPAGRG